MKNFANMSSLKKIAFLTALAVLTLALPRGLADAISDGEASFASGDYPAAERAFQTALSSQGPSAGLYYNLAMAQMRNGQGPAAALSLRRALLLDPRMIDARMALSEVERSHSVPAGPSAWTARWRDILAENVPLKGLAIAGCVIGWAGAFLLLFAIFRSSRKFWPVTGSAMLMLAGLGIFLAATLADPRVSARDAAVVLEEKGASLLSAPADQSAVVAKIPAGTSVQVLRRSGDWTYCATSTGEKGWTSSKGIERVVPTA